MFKNLENKTLLYAEDEQSIQEQYALYFNNIFQEVYLATNGQEALDIYRENRPDAIILDINMPIIDGISLVKLIKSENSKIPILLLTARSDIPTLKKAIELNLVTYLEKPVSRIDLKEALYKLSRYFDENNLLCLCNKRDIYTWDKEKQQLFCNNTHVKLTKNETLLLDLLINSRNICTYQDIYTYVWEEKDKEYNESTIKTLISTLRTKIPKDLIKSQYGVGYFINSV